MYVLGFCFVLALDFFGIVISWVSAERGNYEYFSQHITHFHFRTSIVDLVGLALLRLIIGVSAVFSIERLVKECNADPFDAVRDRKVLQRRLAMVAIFLASTVYLVVKAVFVILWQVKSSVSESHKMDIYYLVGLGVTSGFCLLEDVLCACNWRSMARLRHYLIMSSKEAEDEENQDGQDAEKKKTKNVPWTRLLSLAKRVGHLLVGYMHTGSCVQSKWALSVYYVRR